MKALPIALGLAAAILVGCVGLIDEGAAGPGGAGPRGPGPGPSSTPSLCEGGGEPARIRRLSSPEVEATLRAVFELDAARWSGVDLPPDPANGDGFSTDAQRLRVTDGFAERLLGTARQVATLVSSEPTRSRVLPCASVGDEACARAFLERVGRRMYRRTLTDAERERYLAMLHRVAPAHGFDAWLRAATMAMILSPHTVWRSELGQDTADGHRLTSVERASSLAYALTGAPPSEALLLRGERGELESLEQIRTAARELAIDAEGRPRPAFAAIMSRFFDQWLGLSALETLAKDTLAHPEWSEAVRASMRREADTFVSDLIASRLGVAELLSSGDTYADDTLARYYGWAPTGSGATPVRVARPVGSGSGILAQGAFLSVYASSNASSPTRRGHFVRERILCTTVPPPPATVDPIVPPSEFATTRERYESLHAVHESCRGCHQMMDPIGFSLEHFDGAGRYRETEGIHPIDASGTIVHTSAGDLELAGADDLGPALASLPEVRACIASYAAGYVHGVVHREADCVAERVAARTPDDFVEMMIETAFALR